MKRITLFGSPGCGKTTQMEKVKDTLKKEGKRVLTIPDMGRSMAEKGKDIHNVYTQLQILKYCKEAEILIKKNEEDFDYVLLDGGPITSVIYLCIRSDNTPGIRGLFDIRSLLYYTRLVMENDPTSASDSLSGLFVFLPPRPNNPEEIKDGIRDKDVDNIRTIDKYMNIARNMLMRDNTDRRSVCTVNTHRTPDKITEEILCCISYYYFNHT